MDQHVDRVGLTESEETTLGSYATRSAVARGKQKKVLSVIKGGRGA